jgi:hypothetical protein
MITAGPGVAPIDHHNPAKVAKRHQCGDPASPEFLISPFTPGG